MLPFTVIIKSEAWLDPPLSFIIFLITLRVPASCVVGGGGGIVVVPGMNGGLSSLIIVQILDCPGIMLPEQPEYTVI